MADSSNTSASRPLSAASSTNRTIRASCDSPGAVLSHAFWQREFAGSPDVIGRKLSLDGQSFPVIGVTQPAFFGVEVGNRYDVAIPLCADRLLAPDKKGRMPYAHAWWLSIMGRLKPGLVSGTRQCAFEVLSPGIMKATLPRKLQAGHGGEVPQEQDRGHCGKHRCFRSSTAI